MNNQINALECTDKICLIHEFIEWAKKNSTNSDPENNIKLFRSNFKNIEEKTDKIFKFKLQNYILEKFIKKYYGHLDQNMIHINNITKYDFMLFFLKTNANANINVLDQIIKNNIFFINNYNIIINNEYDAEFKNFCQNLILKIMFIELINKIDIDEFIKLTSKLISTRLEKYDTQTTNSCFPFINNINRGQNEKDVFENFKINTLLHLNDNIILTYDDFNKISEILKNINIDIVDLS